MCVDGWLLVWCRRVSAGKRILKEEERYNCLAPSSTMLRLRFAAESCARVSVDSRYRNTNMWYFDGVVGCFGVVVDVEGFATTTSWMLVVE